MSREHVIPQWLIRSIANHSDGLSAGESAHALDVPKWTRQHTMASFVFRGVCAQCNNGWMSALENEAAPVMGPLSAGRLSAHQLTADQKLILAAWAYKTAVALSIASPGLDSLPGASFYESWTEKRELPTDFALYACRFMPQDSFNAVQSRQWNLIAPGGRSSPSAEQHPWKTVMQFGYTSLALAEIPGGGLVHAYVDGIHVPVWPSGLVAVRYRLSDPVPPLVDHRGCVVLMDMLQLAPEEAVQVSPLLALPEN